jgi:DNA-binding XRE family transcriptional regulator
MVDQSLSRLSVETVPTVLQLWRFRPKKGNLLSVEMSERFAANLTRLRRAAGYSQEDLAFRAAIHRTQVSLLESGSRMPRVETLIKLAGALEVTPDEILEGIVWEPVVRTSGGLKISGN